jgi:dienelactone hydrolase
MVSYKCRIAELTLTITRRVSEGIPCNSVPRSRVGCDFVASPFEALSNFGNQRTTMHQTSSSRLVTNIVVWFVIVGSALHAQSPDSSRLPAENLLVYRNDQGQTEPVKSIEQWQLRKREIRQGVATVMGEMPTEGKQCDWDVKVEEEVDLGSCVRRLITYQSEPHSRVPAYLLIPKVLLDGKKKAPAVLCLHSTDNVIGHGNAVGLGPKPNRAYALELAQRGYVTLAPNYPLLAKYQPDLKSLGWESGTLKAVWDNRRGLDLLASLPYVDASVGFASIGHSLGGHNSVYTAYFDERIKLVVSCCGLDSYVDYYDGDPKNWDLERGWCQTRYMPKLAGYKNRLREIPFDFHELLGSIAPRRVLVIAPLRDNNFRTASAQRVVESASKVFQLYNKSDQISIVQPDCEHDFPDDMRELAYRFVTETLGPGVKE